MKEEEIRPNDLFEKYLSLAKKDCDILFKNKPTINFNCPIHPKQSGFNIFVKNGFNYKQCKICFSIYNSPRHKNEIYNSFYKNGKSVEFWSTEFYKKTAQSRKEKLWKPKVKALINNPILERPIKEYSVVDIGGGYGMFAETLKEEKPKNIFVIEPNINLADICRKKGINVIEKFFNEIHKEDLPKGSKIFTSFELIEHLHNPRGFLLSLRKIMEPGDLLYMTTLTSSGIDIKELKSKSKAITPPQHINFISVSGIQEFLQKEGFKKVVITTPGEIDIDILKKNKDSLEKGFLLDILNTFSNDSLDELQKLIAKNKMSSHMLITARL